MLVGTNQVEGSTKIHWNYVKIYNPRVVKVVAKSKAVVHNLNPLSLLSLQNFELSGKEKSVGKRKIGAHSSNLQLCFQSSV